MDVGDLMSCTNWSYGTEIWDDGNDVVDWDDSIIEDAIENGYVYVNYLWQSGYEYNYLGAGAVKVIVSGR